MMQIFTQFIFNFKYTLHGMFIQFSIHLFFESLLWNVNSIIKFVYCLMTAVNNVLVRDAEKHFKKSLFRAKFINVRQRFLQ